MANLFVQCLGWGLFVIVFIWAIGNRCWNRSTYSAQAPVVECDYSPQIPQTCLDGLGSKDSCISCRVHDDLVWLTNGDLNKYLSQNLPSGAFPLQFINEKGEFINIVRYNDIKCNYDQQLIVQGEKVIPCVINNVLDSFLPSSTLTHYINNAIPLGRLPLNAIPYEED